MAVRKLSSGNLLVPMRAEGDPGELGDSLVEISPEHPQYDGWIEYMGSAVSKQVTLTVGGGKDLEH